MKYRATVCYDGTEFNGFQRQANGRSVQGEIEAALAKITGSAVLVNGAGRTDTGVHASGQVVAFELDWPHSPEALTRAININVPRDVAVSQTAICDEPFHPRFSAISRTYEYSVIASSVPLPLERRYAWVIDVAPDVQRMNDAAKCLLGEHDFAAFGTPPSGENTLRRVIRADWQVLEERPLRLRFTIVANAFLFRMVRRIVDTLVRVGLGKLMPDQVNDILLSKNSARVKGLAPACGLNLVKVTYLVR